MSYTEFEEREGWFITDRLRYAKLGRKSCREERVTYNGFSFRLFAVGVFRRKGFFVLFIQLLRKKKFWIFYEIFYHQKI